MKDKEERHDTYADQYRKLRLDSDPDYHIGQAKWAQGKLAKALEGLPRVDADGSSSSPYAADQYRQKEALHAQAKKTFDTLELCLEALSKEITRCRRNLGRIAKGTGSVQTPGTRLRTQKALALQAQQYKKAQQQRLDFLAVYEALKALLKESDSKRYPGADNAEEEQRARKKPEPASQAGQPKKPTGGKKWERPNSKGGGLHDKNSPSDRESSK